jgi:hypothetical protein
VARHFHPAPCAQQPRLLVDDEGAALNAADLSPVQVLVLHDAERAAGLLVGIGKELERKLQLGLEPGAPELLVEVAEIGTRGAALAGKLERAAAGAGKTEVGYRLAERFQRF